MPPVRIRPAGPCTGPITPPPHAPFQAQGITTFDPNKIEHGNFATLSNGNRTATGVNGTNPDNGTVGATTFRSNGKWVVAFTMDNFVGSNVSVGFADPRYNFTDIIQFSLSPHGVCWRLDNSTGFSQNIWINGSLGPDLTTINGGGWSAPNALTPAGQEVQLLVDFAAKKLYLALGGSPLFGMDPVAGTGGIDISALDAPLQPVISFGDANTASIKPVSSYVPAGYSTWDVSTANTYSLSCATGVFNVNGQAMTPAVAMPAATGIFSLTGNAATLTHGYPLVASTGVFTVTGRAMTPAVAMTASTGVFALTGNPVTLRVSMPATTGVFAVTGQSATLAVTMNAATGVFTVNGQAAALKAARIFSLATGVFTVNGQAAGLYKGKTLAGSVGTFTLSGAAASLLVGMPLTTAAFILTGNPMTPAVKMAGATGTFSLTGYAVALKAGRYLALAPGVFSLTGRPAGTIAGRKIVAGTGAFTVTGYNIQLFAGAAEKVATVIY